MKKITGKRKEWLDRQSRIGNERVKYKKPTKSAHSRIKKVVVKAPEIFSLSENLKETIEYFHRIDILISERVFRRNIYMDLHEVKLLTTDCIMYIIALVHNFKMVKFYNMSISGNTPIDKEANSMLDQSGFYQYVASLRPSQKNKDKMQIISGNSCSPDIAREVCDFVNIRCGKTKENTLDLYPHLIEMMNNVVHHAYAEGSNEMVENWYISLEDIGDKIRLVFLDTGVGIPRTVRSSFFEKIRFLGVGSDVDLIESALKGEFRTATKEKNRGTGLPGIYSACSCEIIEEVMIFSGNACCVINDSCKIEKKDFAHTLHGTLFCWTILK